MALAFPVLLLMLLLAAEVGRAYFMATQLSNAAREGALWAAHNASKETSAAQLDTDTKTVIAGEERTSASILVCPTQVVTITRTNNTIVYPTPTSGQSSDEQISVTCTYNTLVHIRPIPSTLTIGTKVSTFLVVP